MNYRSTSSEEKETSKPAGTTKVIVSKSKNLKVFKPFEQQEQEESSQNYDSIDEIEGERKAEDRSKKKRKFNQTTGDINEDIGWGQGNDNVESE